MPSSARSSLPTWIQQRMIGVPAALTMEAVWMIETDPQRAALWYRVLDVTADQTVAIGQLPFAPWTHPRDLPLYGVHHLGQVMTEVLEPF